MKQHITVEQLRELSDKGMERLHNLVFKGRSSLVSIMPGLYYSQ